MTNLERLDEIAREAWAGNYDRTGGLSTGERLYVALASGRMRELCPGDSIPYSVDRVGRVVQIGSHGKVCGYGQGFSYALCAFDKSTKERKLSLIRPEASLWS